jgi:uroporphyrinogen-III synthase
MADLAAHVIYAARAVREGPGPEPVGREAQPALGRHTPEYQATVGPTVGMFPMGQAGRVTLDEHLADGADVDRGDAYSWKPPRFNDEETPDAS